MSLSPTFLENIVLLILTALITGFGIPYVLKKVEARKLQEQKKFEASLIRQGKIIESQSKLLDDLSELLWKWRYLAKKVVYYGSEKNMERYDLARKQYDESVWDILQDFRAEISRSRRLVSENAFEKLNKLYGYVVYEIDQEISDLIKMEELDVERAIEIAQRFSEEVSKRLDDAIDDLASELNLKIRD